MSLLPLLLARPTTDGENLCAAGFVEAFENPPSSTNSPRRPGPLVCAAAWLLAASLAAAAEPAGVRLAPGPADLQRVTVALRGELERADAAGTALSRVHNQLAVLLEASGSRPSCDTPELASLLARTGPLGAAWRASAQRARTALSEAERYAASPTLAPLVGEGQAAVLASLRAEVDLEQRRYLEASAWQARYAAPLARRCPVSLAAAPGLPLVTVPAIGDPADPPVAVIGLGGGRVCPADVPADGGVVVLATGRGCYGVDSCDCVLAPVLPAAVLGP